MTSLAYRALLLPFAAALLAACGGGEDSHRAAAAPDSAAAQRVWTPDQARALRQAREQGQPAAVVAAPRPGPSEEEDSAQWAAAEKVNFDKRVASMQPYADCMAQARAVRVEQRAPLEAACRRLPSAPH